MHLFTSTIRFEKSYVTCKCEKKSPSRDAAGKIYAIKAISDETIKTLFCLGWCAYRNSTNSRPKECAIVNVYLLMDDCFCLSGFCVQFPRNLDSVACIWCENCGERIHLKSSTIHTENHNFCEREFISSNYFLIVIISKSILICLCVKWVIHK